MIYKTIVQILTLLFTKCHTFKKNGMHMMGYILIRRNFLNDSALLDLTFFHVYSKPVLSIFMFSGSIQFHSYVSV